MKIHQPIPSTGRMIRSSGFTFIEMLVSIGLGVVVVGVVSSLAIVTSWNFVATSNYVQLDNQSRNALDLISREIRNSTKLLAFSTNNPQYLLLTNAIDAKSATITFNSESNTVTLARSGFPTATLLTGCDSFSFSLFNRYPIATNNTFSFYQSTNFLNGSLDPTFTKVINMTWKCSRTILGSKLNTEIVQTAQVVLRNKVN